jgi:hypothetical protein
MIRGWRLLVLLCCSLMPGCEHPIAVVTPHAEVADLVLSTRDGLELARTRFNRSWNVDSLVIPAGAPLELTIEARDFQGNPLAIDSRPGFGYRFEAVAGALLQWEPRNGYYRLNPFGVGGTEARLLVWHTDHADFVSPWLRIVVRPAASTLTR